MKNKFNTWCDKVGKWLNRPIVEMVSCIILMLFIILFAIEIGYGLTYKEFEIMSTTFMLAIITYSPIVIVHDFFETYKEYKKDKKHE